MSSILRGNLGRSGATQQGQYWHLLDDGRIQCDLCPRYCRLREGQRGLCFVRQRSNNAVTLTSYGRSSGFCIDPIEKKPLNHFLPGTPVLSFGTAGCNLACKFCQNWDMSKSRAMDTLADAASPEALVATAIAHGARSIAFTYNDPVIFHEYAVDVARRARQHDIAAVAVTAGYICDEPRVAFFRYMDAVNIDLKAFSERFYRAICGGQLAAVLETIAYVYHETNCWLELTTLLIPGENDSDAEIAALSDWIMTQLGPEVPLHFTAFHPDYRMREKPPTPPQSLLRARQIARRQGLQHVYTGNIDDVSSASTWCPQCDGLLIERNRYQLGPWQLDAQACCRHCGALLVGVFEADPGEWGPRRQPIRIAR